MARIDDFGEKLHGAAKDRWRAYGVSIENARHLDVLDVPLSRSFPEPPYGKLIEDGVDPWVVAFVRSARDIIPPRPRTRGVSSWASQVVALRNICAGLVEGRLGRDRVEEKLSEPRYERLKREIDASLSLYMALGHEKSLKGYKLQPRTTVRRETGGWMVTGKGRFGPGSRTILAEGKTPHEAIEAFLETLGSAPARRRSSGPELKLYRYPGDPARRVHIGVKLGRTTVDLESFPDVTSARAFLADNRDALLERIESMKRIPPLRLSDDTERTGGNDLGGRDVTPEEFAETFRFRGVQFGNYVEAARRQKDLNDTWVSLMDLSQVIGCAPADLSLGGRLGLAFGARGSGGIGAASAHYEPNMVVINLTKNRGAGSLAHEWFHALDNLVAAGAGDRLSFASQGGGAPGDAAPMMTLLREIRKIPLEARSRQLDRYRSTPYFGTAVEMAARSFEAWVKDSLEARGIRNDHLVNITPEDVWKAECRLLGRDEDSWPYPRPEELERLDPLFARVIRSEAVRRLLTSPAREEEIMPGGPS